MDKVRTITAYDVRRDLKDNAKMGRITDYMSDEYMTFKQVIEQIEAKECTLSKATRDYAVLYFKSLNKD